MTLHPAAPPPTGTAATPGDLLTAVASKGAITAEDVAALRRRVFADGVCDQAEAEAVFALERACPDRHPDWNAFYVDALTDWLVWRRDPRGYVDGAAADFLIGNVMHDGRLDGPTEFELLLNVVHWAESTPQRLKDFALTAASDSIRDPMGAVWGKQRRGGVVDQVDVEIVRRVVYARGLDGSITVTRQEADWMVDLAEATRGADNAAAWPDLFARVVACHLMFPRGAPAPVSAEEVRRREAWLENRRGFGTLLGEVGRSLGRGEVDAKGFWDWLDPFGRRARAEAEAARAAEEEEAARREGVDAAEAAWLISRFPPGTESDPCLRALLAFLRNEARFIDPAAAPLFDRAGL